MTCPRCGKENEAEAIFCSKCGLELAQVRQKDSEERGDLVPCAKHPKELTALRCGRCDKPVCTRCVIIGPAGPRCRECAKQHVELRPAGILHSFTSSFRGIGRMSPWIIVIAVGLLLSAIRGCSAGMQSRPYSDEPARIESDDVPQ